MDRAYLAGQGAFPQRAALNQLGGRFLTDFYAMVAHWADWATTIVQDWPDDPAPPSSTRPPRRKASASPNASPQPTQPQPTSTSTPTGDRDLAVGERPSWPAGRAATGDDPVVSPPRDRPMAWSAGSSLRR
jgi:hypothetical protein